jgi:hypothetical protein
MVVSPISVIPILIVTWIPFSNGMTGAVRHLDAGKHRHDEPLLLSKARDFNQRREEH